MRPALAAALLAAAVQAAACELPGGGSRTVDSPRFALAYRTQPARIAVGEHFVVEIAVCAKGNAVLPGAVAVDAWMPEHFDVGGERLADSVRLE